ncbi:MFS transporter [Paraburkholderia sp. GAS334]|uniref:MFS transporter n=1 Tax=Paraburkholderia sp. GAS334 TaxID=3035131 RepID=UPI003D239125
MLDTVTQTVVAPGASRAKALSGPALALILGILGASYVFNGMDRQMFPALLGPINREYHLALSEGSFLTTIFVGNVALFSAFSSWFMKRFGRRATLVGGLLSYSLFTFITPMATSFYGLAVYRALTGAGEALQICAIFSCVGAYFGDRRGAAMGVINASFGLGAFLGPVLGTLIFSRTGSWQMPFYVFGVAGIVAAILVQIIVPKQFSEAADTERATSGVAAIVGPTRILNRNLIILVTCFYLFGVAFFSFTALYAAYLRVHLGYSVGEAGMTFGLYGIGALGGFVGGWLGEKFRTRGMLGALAALAIVSYLMFHGAASHYEQGILSLGFGLLASGYLYPRFVSVIQRNVPSEKVIYAVSIGMTFFYVSGLLSGYAFGRLTEALGWSSAASLMMAAPPALAFVLMLFYRPGMARGA